MGELFRADLKRVLKDKLLIVMGILAVVFALITPLLYAAIFSMDGLLEDSMLASLVSAKSQFFQSFSMTNNLGLIAPVLLAIVLCKDFSFGTVRNKIIAGKSRVSIYLSLFAVCALVLGAVMFLSAFLSLGVSLIFFDYQSAPFTFADFGYFMASLGFQVLVLLFMAALLSLLCGCTKNVGSAIVLYVAITFLLVLVGSIVQAVCAVLQLTGMNPELVDVLLVLDRLNVGRAVAYIGAGTSYTWKDVLYLLLPPLVGILGFTGFGILRFRRKDLK